MNWTSADIAARLRLSGWIPDPLAPGFYRHDDFNFGLHSKLAFGHYDSEVGLLVMDKGKRRGFKFELRSHDLAELLPLWLGIIRDAIESEHAQ